MDAWVTVSNRQTSPYREMVPEMRAARHGWPGPRTSGAFVAFIAYVAPLLVEEGEGRGREQILSKYLDIA